MYVYYIFSLAITNYVPQQAIENHFNSSTSSGNDIVNETPFYSISQVGLGLARSPIFLALNLIKGILWLTLRILRLPLWLFEYATRPSIEYIPPLREPNDCNRLLVQSIEESVNSCYPTSSSTSTSTTIASNLNSRKPISLPSFFVGTYNDAMREVKENAQFGIFGFVKSGNEDDCQFKANVLANDQFKNILNEHDCLIWIGDVNENKDAFNGGCIFLLKDCTINISYSCQKLRCNLFSICYIPFTSSYAFKFIKFTF